MDYEEMILAYAEALDWGDEYIPDDAETEEHYNPVLMRMIAEYEAKHGRG